jgi:hypothetical protein
MTIDSRRIFNIYKSLDKDQVQFVVDKKIEDTMAIDEWLTRLHKIAEMDTLGDETRKKSGNLSIVFGVLSVLTIVLSIAKPLFFFFPIAFLILFIYFVVTYFLLRKIDIGNNMRLFIVPMLEHYQRKGSLEDPFYLRMDFSNPVQSDFLSQTIEEEKEQPNNIYKHHWMDGRMVFNDGVKISWEIKDVIRKKESEARDTSGQSDYTGKFQIHHVLNMHFSAPKKHFNPANKDMMETDDGEYYITSIHKKDISDSLDEGMSPDVFISSIQEGYHFVESK